jgi:hypothetical protein
MMYLGNELLQYTVIIEYCKVIALLHSLGLIVKDHVVVVAAPWLLRSAKQENSNAKR